MAHLYADARVDVQELEILVCVVLVLERPLARERRAGAAVLLVPDCPQRGGEVLRAARATHLNTHLSENACTEETARQCRCGGADVAGRRRQGRAAAQRTLPQFASYFCRTLLPPPTVKVKRIISGTAIGSANASFASEMSLPHAGRRGSGCC